MRAQDGSGKRKHKRSVAQSPAPSRIRCKIRVGCLWFCVHWGLEITKDGGCKTFLSTNLLLKINVHQVKKGFLIHSLNLSFFSPCPVSPSLAPYTREKPDSKSCHVRQSQLWSLPAALLLLLDSAAGRVVTNLLWEENLWHVPTFV